MTFFRNSDRSSSITGDALYATTDKRHITDEKWSPDRAYLYLAGGREGAIDIEQDKFVDRSVSEGLEGHPGRNDDGRGEKTRNQRPRL